MTPALITSMVSDEGGNLIYDDVGLPKDMSNSHYNGKVEKALHIMEDRMSIRILCLIPDLANNSDRITLKNNLPHLQVLSRIDNTYPSSIKLHF